MLSDPNSSAISERAFLVGCPRSGTTLLQSMLMAHPEIHSFPETKFFIRSFGGRWRWMLHETLRGGYLWYLIVRWLVENGYLTRGDVYNIPLSWSKTEMVEVFRGVLDCLTAEQEAEVWIEKTPRHLHCMDAIQRHMPAAQFIHIVRDGRAVVASMYKLAYTHPDTWGHYQSIDRIIQRWNRCIKDTLRYADDDRHTVVRYERLVETPRQVLQEFSSTLNVKYNSAMIEDFHHQAARVVKPHEAWKKGTTTSSSLENRGLDKFHSVLSIKQQEYVSDHLNWSKYQNLERLLV